MTLALVAACTGGSEGRSTSTASIAPASTDATGGVVVPPPPPTPTAVVARTQAADPAAGDQVTVTAYVLSDAPVTGVELWAGPTRVDRVELRTPLTTASEVLTWQAATVGLHPLLVRTVDTAGRTAQSFPVWVRVAQVDPPVPRPDGLRRSVGGCTTEIDVPPAAAAGIVVYAATIGAGGFTVLDVLGPAGGVVPVPAVSGPTVLYTEAFTGTESLLSSPIVTEPCPGGGWTGELDLDGGLLVADVDRAYLYVSTDGSSWERVPAADQTFVGPRPDGRFDFTDLLPAVAPGGSLTVEAWGWRAGSLVALGRARFAADPSPSPTGDGGAGPNVWTVVPGLPVVPTKGALDWVVPTVDNSDIQKPVKGEGLLREALLCTFQPGSQLVLPVECANGPSGALPSTTFRWQPAPGAFTHGVWQVSVVPPPDAPLLSFPGLIGMGPVGKPAGVSIDFPIPDLAAMLASTAPAAAKSATKDPGYEAVKFSTVAALGAVVGGGATPPASAQKGLTLALPPSWTGVLGEAVLPVTPGKPGLYVRVIPIDGVQPQPQTSNLVAFDLDHTAPPPPPLALPAFTLTATAQPPRLPNTAYAHCLRVVDNPFGSQNPVPKEHKATPWAAFYPMFEANAYRWVNGVKVHQGLVPGATVCALEPSPPDDDWWDVIVDAVNAVAWVWDLYSDVYGMLKEKIVDALVFASGCEAFLDEEDCQAVGGLVVTFAAAYVGLPPTLPKFGELVEAAQGDLKQWLITAAAQSGILDCGSSLQATCEAVAEEMLDELLDTIEKEATKAATAQAKSGGYTLLLNPAIKVVPEPAGTLSPAVVTVTLTRTANPSSVTTCQVTASVVGSTTWSWDADDGFHTNEKVSAVLMKGSVTVNVAGMSAGQSKTVTLVLDKLADVFLPGQPPWKGSYINPEYDPSGWIFFFTPAVLSVGGGSPCAAAGSPPVGGSANTDWPQDNVATEPWEIP